MQISSIVNFQGSMAVFIEIDVFRIFTTWNLLGW